VFSTFVIFFFRFCDISAEIRIECVQMSKTFLIANSALLRSDVTGNPFIFSCFKFSWSEPKPHTPYLQNIIKQQKFMLDWSMNL